ncbi:MAG TPA: glycogen debranching enzyme N-terminal domain-containing protein, partial [Ktedonobacteraceae bacterium]|nr:glycogen debranching enzyme N-terminal domain-containing protein [Ktedonobacteraceae bacterium]
MPIALDRGMCCDLNQTMVREWLITNGIGGYAAGTVAGVLTRNQHGLLVADLPGEMLPQLLLAKVDEEVVFDQRTYYLGTNEYRDGTIKPAGFVHLESFHLEDGFSTFTYRLGGINGIVFEKRIWMPPEQNTTCIQYRVISTNMQERADTHTSRGTLDDDSPTQQQRALMITLLPFTTYRPYNQLQSVNQHFQLQADHFADHMPSSMRPRIHISAEPLVGCTISATSAAQPYHMLALSHPDCHPTFIPTGVWYGNFLRRHDSTAEQPAIDDLYLPGVVRAALWPDDD